MNQKDFEGTLVLEKLATIGALDDFLRAVDSDDFKMANLLMRKAQIDPRTILAVIKKMSTSDRDY